MASKPAVELANVVGNLLDGGTNKKKRSNSVPNRANKRTKYYVTNGGVGTDNTRIYSHDLGSNQGRAAMRRAVRTHRDVTGKQSWAESKSGKKINIYG
jgi:hypothetical protein